jgi:hypothetical protein
MLLKVSKEVSSGRSRRAAPVPPKRPNALEDKINTAFDNESSEEELCGFEAFDKAKNDPQFA